MAKRGRPVFTGQEREESIARRKRLDIERANARHAHALSSGLCWDCCRVPPREGRRTCVDCGVKAVKRALEYQRQRWYDGLCTRCGKPNQAAPRQKCDTCAHADKVRVVLSRKGPRR